MLPPTSVLIVDDEPAVRDLMARWVASLGMKSRTAASALEALDALRTEHCDLAVIDVMMPGRDGLWLAAALQREHPQTAVVIATARELGDRGSPPSIADLLVKPFPRERFVLAVDRGRQWRKEALDQVHWHATLTEDVRDRTTQICALLRRWGLVGAREAEALAAFARERTPEVAAHGERVARYARSVVRELGAEGSLGEAIELTARFHDIGKVAMPDALMTKPSALTADEAAIMRQHVEVGAQILEAAATLTHIAPAVRATHEWFGGGGYPYGLAGPAIPLLSRIVAVADAYDAMTHERSYRPQIKVTDAVTELLRCTPVQFDPDIVNAFLTVLGRH